VPDDPDYSRTALAAIGAKATPAQLAAKLPTIVLERLARGGGATNWYLLREPRDIDALAGRLKPGSCVSFYFDDRLTLGPLDDGARASVLAIAVRDGSAVIGATRSDEIEIEVDFPSNEGEVDQFVTDHPSSTLMFGAFPDRDDDGELAVTLMLPDADGVVRPHPH
jgi:hypothetical protein